MEDDDAPEVVDGSDEQETADDPVDADGWIDLFNSKIKVRQLGAGSGSTPEVKQDVVCTYEVRTFADAAESSPLQVYKDVRLRIGEGECPPGVELCLRRMKEGETYEVYCVSTMAWGPAGRRGFGPEEQDVPGDVDLHFRVELHKCIEPEVTFDALLEEIVWRKTTGSEHFRRKDFQKARRAYRAALEVYKNMAGPPEDMEDRIAAAERVDSLAADCNSNLAAVHLELGDTSLAKEAATHALEANPDHPKALFRVAKACFLLHEHKECELALKRLRELQPEDPAVRKLFHDLRQAQKEYVAKSKKLAAKLWEAPREGYKEEQKEEEQDEVEADDAEDDEEDEGNGNEEAEERKKAREKIGRQATYILSVICGSLAVFAYVVWVQRRRKYGMQYPLIALIAVLAAISIACFLKELLPKKVKAD
mmetsp:Transcript_2179/g.3713  ORF Transcript_2179/g.3713 Transcript_2179/m.3713 type:complete len:422 (+) Transcript_2179:104-1369(+)